MGACGWQETANFLSIGCSLVRETHGVRRPPGQKCVLVQTPAKTVYEEVPPGTVRVVHRYHFEQRNGVVCVSLC